MEKGIFVLWFIVGYIVNSFGQDSSLTKAMESKVLCKNIIDREFCFNISTHEQERNIVKLKYLGCFETNNQTSYKVLTWERIWGSNFHTTGVIKLFDKNNMYIGKYVLGDASDLPYKIEGSNLIFTNKNKKDCDTNLVTSIDFSKGVPEDIFLKCKGNIGDVYSFSKEE